VLVCSFTRQYEVNDVVAGGISFDPAGVSGKQTSWAVSKTAGWRRKRVLCCVSRENMIVTTTLAVAVRLKLWVYRATDVMGVACRCGSIVVAWNCCVVRSDGAGNNDQSCDGADVRRLLCCSKCDGIDAGGESM
jgi:hypothetical protein